MNNIEILGAAPKTTATPKSKQQAKNKRENTVTTHT